MKNHKEPKEQNPYVKWFFVHVLNHKMLFTLNFIGIIAVCVTRTIIPKRIGAITDAIVELQISEQLLTTILILLALYFTRNIVEYATWMIGHQLGSKSEQSMRREFFQNVQNKPLSFHDGIKTGDLQALATNDLRVVNTLIAHGSFYLYPFVQTIITLIQVQTFNWMMGLIIIPFLGLYVIFVLRYRKHLLPYSKQSLTRHADVTVSLQESLNSVQVAKAFVAEEFEYRKFRKSVQEFRKNRLGEIRIQARFYPLLTLYAAIGVSAIAGTLLIIYGFMTIGQLTAVLLLLFALINPTDMIFWATRDMIRGFGASERLFAIISKGKVELLPDTRTDYTKVFKGAIEFKNVSFTYNNSNSKSIQVLKNLSFKIKPNQRVALVGPTGCGKTTLAKLLLRLYDPQEGTILLDGQPIQEYPLEMVRQQVSLIEQDIYLFSQTIEENIKFGFPDASKEKVIEVTKLAQAHDFISNFDLGYETIVGERGTTLSGGEKQRVAIARAFLTNPDILILDDSMSAIDSETEAKIGQAIENILEDRTALIITHRLHTIRTSDLILVMKNGEIVAQGEHEELLKTSKDYRKVFGMHLEDAKTTQEVN
ncbi:MAG: ABC transporter ATP-binding protein [Candidatus Heimdallarchaeota archaeon]|nr:ABC transporter ATP-binding protein [Candidatus Heimdallarchaeota archaeon]MBY8994222.1 ABC transporter ATP-binding protein [Candidatus Heimdallarchaeota archaeon]